MTDRTGTEPAAESATAEPPKGMALIATAFSDRRTLAMLLLGFGAGLPIALLIGTMNAWLTEAGVTAATIGVLSWIGLFHAFKFLWSPIVNAPLPFLGKLGLRRGWLILLQAVIIAGVAMVAVSHPETGVLGPLAAGAALGAFASATQDIVIDVWRIEIASPEVPVDLLSAIYQMGFRSASLAGGAGALFLSGAIGWRATFLVGAATFILPVIGTLIAPEPVRPPREALAQQRRGSSLQRNLMLGIVLAAWAWAAFQIVSFMVRAITETPAPSAGTFTGTVGPWIIAAAVLLPCALAAFLARRPVHVEKPEGTVQITASRLFNAVLAPLTELMGRLGWGALLVLALILSYRFTDGVWGAFAFPFYMGSDGGALGHTAAEVAVASKIFGIVMTIVGIALGGWLLIVIGRMATLLIGAILAAATNLLFADLAMGAPVIGGLMSATGLYAVFGFFGVNEGMARLMFAISGENIAAGLAGAAFVAYLSALASRLYGAVQFAVFTSLALLIGTFGRGALGEMIDNQGFAPVFVLTAWLGGVAVVLCVLEWVRVRHEARKEAAVT